MAVSSAIRDRARSTPSVFDKPSGRIAGCDKPLPDGAKGAHRMRIASRKNSRSHATAQQRIIGLLRDPGKTSRTNEYSSALPITDCRWAAGTCTSCAVLDSDESGPPTPLLPFLPGYQGPRTGQSSATKMSHPRGRHFLAPTRLRNPTRSPGTGASSHAEEHFLTRRETIGAGPPSTRHQTYIPADERRVATVLAIINHRLTALGCI